MRITDVHIENFGPHVDWRPGEAGIAPGLTVIFGPNESGKSAFRAFLRMVLFGRLRANAKEARWFNYTHALAAPGAGSVSVELSDGSRYTVHRAEGKAPTVTGDRAGGDGLLRELTGHIDATVYQNVFSVSLTELESMDSLSGDQVRDRIYSAGLGLGAVSLPVAMKTLENERSTPAGLWSERAGRLRVGLRTLRAREADLRAAADELAGYESLTGEIADLRGEIEQNEHELRAARAAAVRLGTINELRPHAGRMADLKKRISGLPRRDGFPKDGPVRLKELRAELHGLENQLSEGDLESASQRQVLGSLTITPGMSEHADEIRRLVADRTAYQEAARDLPGLEQRLADRHHDLTSGLAGIGPGWDEQRLRAFDELHEARRRVDETGASLRAADDARRSAHSDLEQARVAEETAEAGRDRALRALDSLSDVPGESRKELEDRGGRIQRLQSAIADREDLRLRLETAAARRPSLRLAAPLMLGLALAGVAEAAVAAVLGETVALAAGLALAAVMAFLFVRERRRGAAAVSGSSTARELEAIAREVAGISVELGFEESPPRRALVEAQHAVTRAIQLRAEYERLTAELNEARAAVKAASTDSQARARAAAGADARYEEELARWRRLLAGHSLPESLDQTAAVAALGRVDTLRSDLRAVEDLRTRVAQVAGFIDDVESRLRPVLEAVGLSGFERRSAGSALADLEKRFGEHLEAASRADTVRLQLEHWAVRRRSIKDRMRSAEARIRELLSSAGVDNDRSFTALATAVEESASLEHDLDRLLEAHPPLAETGDGSVSAQIAASTHEQVEAARLAAEDEAGRLKSEMDGLRERLGGLQQRRDEAEQSNPAASLQAEIDELEQNVDEDAHRWAVLTIAKQLLDATRAEYQDERQAPLMRIASRHFERFTRGTHTKVETVVGEQQIRVVERTGRIKNVTELSRGAAEQLYLAMRFALIDEYSQHSEPMPVLMDDVMVNFDTDRARAAFRAVVELSEDHQVIVLTCHEATVSEIERAAQEAGPAPPALVTL